jgi:hypothetical protein
MGVLLGVLAGAHASSWGMYKDAPHEGFTYTRYFRSVVVAAAIAAVLQLVAGVRLASWADAAVFFGMVYALERLGHELWKGYLREEDQSKYFIPMQFGIMGRPVRSRAVRWPLLLAILVVLALLVWLGYALQARYPAAPAWLVLVTLGSLGGWITAFGGAWKDAPVEGFETLKFFRSPLVALSWAVVMAFLTRDWVFISVAAAGYSVATIETYKTFFFPSVPRGKFAGKPVLHPEMLERRRPVVGLYAAIWAAMLAILVLAFLGPRDGLLG